MGWHRRSDYLKRRQTELKSKRWKSLRGLILWRDRYTCALTGQVGGWLEVHHILPYWRYPRLRWDARNLITLSKRAHDLVTANPYKYMSKLWKIAQEREKERIANGGTRRKRPRRKQG